MAKVDVVIPYYNVPLVYTKPALESVLAQTFTDWKVLLVDDGSKSEFAKAIESEIKRINDPRIIYIRQDNKGVSAARNTAITSSNSPYVAMLDPDDLWHPEKLEKQVNFLDQNPNIAFVHSESDVMSTDGKIKPARHTELRLKLEKENLRNASLKMLETNYVAGVNSVLMRRDALVAIGNFDTAFESVEDKELYLRFMAHGHRLAYLQVPTATYRWYGDNVSKNVEKMKAGRLRLVEKVDQLTKHFPDWLGEDWTWARTKLRRHAYIDAAGTAYMNKDFVKTIKYSLPHNSGWSVFSLGLIAKSLIRSIIRR